MSAIGPASQPQPSINRSTIEPEPASGESEPIFLEDRSKKGDWK